MMDEEAHEATPVYGLALRPDGRGCCSGGGDRHVKFWDFEVRNIIYCCMIVKIFHYLFVHLFVHLFVLFAQMKGAVLTMTLTRQLQLPRDVLCLAYSPTKQVSKLLVAVGLLDGTIKLLYDDSLKFFLSLYGHKLPVLCLDISDDCSLLVSGSADKTVKIWGLDFGDCHRSLLAHEDSVTSIKFQPHTHYFFTSSKDSNIKYWDADRFECILLLSGHRGAVWSLSLSTEAATLLSCGQDRSVRVWRRNEGSYVFVEEEKEKQMEMNINKAMEQEARAEQADHITAGGSPAAAGSAGVLTVASAASIKVCPPLL
jgi:U3 small nucleolar RNA-associated protein 12